MQTPDKFPLALPAGHGMFEPSKGSKQMTGDYELDLIELSRAQRAAAVKLGLCLAALETKKDK
jgi:hypothetical protein